MKVGQRGQTCWMICKETKTGAFVEVCLMKECCRNEISRKILVIAELMLARDGKEERIGPKTDAKMPISRRRLCELLFVEQSFLNRYV